MKRSEVATDLAQQLFAAEAAVEQAFLQLGALAQALPEARSRSGMAATVGQKAFEAVLQSMDGQVQSRRAMIALHEELARLKEQSPYRSVAIGGGEKTEEWVPRETRLAVVAG